MSYDPSVKWSYVSDKLEKAIAQNFQWKIENFSSLPQEVGDFYESPEFSSSGYAWCLKLFPNGEILHSSEGWIGFYVEMLNTNLKRADLIVGIEDKTGTVKFMKGIRSLSLKKYVAGGWIKFLKRDELISQKSEFYPSDTLIAKFSIIDKTDTGLKSLKTSKKIGTIEIGGPRMTDDMKGVITLSDNLRDVFLNGEGSDVTITVGEKTFKVHKAILKARCNVLSSMLTQDVVDIKLDDDEVHDSGFIRFRRGCDPETFEIFLLYLYTGKVEYFTDDNMLDLYKIAAKYDNTGLIADCVSFIARAMTKENYMEIKIIANTYQDSKLLDCVENFVIPQGDLLEELIKKY